MIAQNKPFFLGIHFNSPHPPMVVSSKYYNYYFAKRKALFVSPSINDKMTNSAYAHNNGRDEPTQHFDDRVKVSQVTAVYYGMIQEGTCTEDVVD